MNLCTKNLRIIILLHYIYKVTLPTTSCYTQQHLLQICNVKEKTKINKLTVKSREKGEKEKKFRFYRYFLPADLLLQAKCREDFFTIRIGTKRWDMKLNRINQKTMKNPLQESDLLETEIWNNHKSINNSDFGFCFCVFTLDCLRAAWMT